MNRSGHRPARDGQKLALAHHVPLVDDGGGRRAQMLLQRDAQEARERHRLDGAA